MLTDAHIATRLQRTIDAIVPPAAPVNLLLARRATSHVFSLRRGPSSVQRLAVAAGILVMLTLVTTPLVAPGFVQTFQTRLAQLLQWAPPPPPSKAIESGMVQRRVTLDEARRLVGFHLVAPAGLPRGAVLENIVAIPVAIYTKRTHSWTVGAPSLTFSYRRSGGGEFALTIDEYDSNAGPPPKYIFNADEKGPDGLPRRYRNFAWRNGDQETSVVADANISAWEAEAIRGAMKGTPLPLATTRAQLNDGSIVKRYGVP